jgi:hypothetical protein
LLTDASHAVLGAFFAICWIAALLYSAQLFAPRTPLDPVDRIRYALILGCAEPLGLGLLHVFYPATLLIVTLALCVACRVSARQSVDFLVPRRSDIILMLTALATASPNIVRPPLEGDTLLYHLPNAIAWVQSGSLDPTWMRYWWYPGGSELVVAGLISAGGLWIAGVPNLLAATMLALRLQAWLRELSVGQAAAVSLAAAYLTIPIAALQTYDVRNDLVSAAWFVESLWVLRKEPTRAVLALAMLSIVKPYGWLLALVAILCAGRWRSLVALLPVGLWAAHDLLLDRHAVITMASTQLHEPWPTTIAANFPQSLAELGRALADQGPATATFFVAALAGFLGKDDRRVMLAGLLSIVVFVFTPLSFASYLPTLATGASLRYALPGLAIGALALAPIARRFPRAILVAGVLSSIFGIAHIFQVFANDSFTIISWAGVGVISALAMIPERTTRAAAVAISTLALFLRGVDLARVRATSFYADEMPRVGGRSTLFYDWFTQHAHSAYVVDLRAGKLLVLAPSTHIVDGLQIDCDAARRDGSWIIVGADRDVPIPVREARFEAARKCGPALFGDAAVVVSKPL